MLNSCSSVQLSQSLTRFFYIGAVAKGGEADKTCARGAEARAGSGNYLAFFKNF
jgi:hypothetical protein